MPHLEELRLLAKVARLYYEQKLNQSAIAERLDLSQATISRLIKRAEAEGIVRITVSMPPGIHAGLEDALVEKYDLKEVIIADCDSSADEESIQRVLGAAAAYYLESTLKKGDVIGISSWSATLLAMVDAMHPVGRSLGAQVVQILGGIGNPDAEVHANRLTDRLTKLVHGTAVYLAAPGIVGSETSRRVLLEDPFVSETVALFDQVTVALVGIGSIQPSSLLMSSGNSFSQDELAMVRQRGAIGDICLRFFDERGEPVITSLDQRVIGVSLQHLQQTERTIGIAGGQRKHAAIRGALRGRWVNVLITDRLTASALIAT